MDLNSIAGQQAGAGIKTYYVKQGSENEAATRSLLSGAGFAANPNESLNDQVKRFQTAQGLTTDGKAGTQTLNKLREINSNNQQESEGPTGLSNASAQEFVAKAARTAPHADEIAAGPSRGQTRVNGATGPDGARKAIDATLAQDQRLASMGPHKLITHDGTTFHFNVGGKDKLVTEGSSMAVTYESARGLRKNLADEDPNDPHLPALDRLIGGMSRMKPVASARL